MTTTATPPRAGWADLFGPILAHRSLVAGVLGLGVATALLSLAQPLLVQRILDAVTHQQVLGSLPWLLAAAMVTGAVLGGLRQYLVSRLAEGAVLLQRQRLIDHLLRLPIRQIETHRTGDLVSRVNSDTTTVRTLLTQGFVESLAGVITLVGAIIGMARIDLLLLGVALGVSLVAVIIVVTVTSLVERASLDLQTSVGRVSASVERALRAVRTIRANNATRQETARVVADAERAREVGLRVARIIALVTPLSGVAMQGAFLGVLGLGGYRVAVGDLTVADLVAFILFLFLLIMPLGAIFGTLTAVGEAMGGLGRIKEVLDIEAEPRDVGVAPLGAAVDITLRQVGFAYGPEGRPALDDVSLTIPAGHRVALVGPSGAGKSTLLSLLLRFDEPTTGEIRFGSTPSADLTREQVRAMLGYVEQDSTALTGSLRDNLLLGRPDADDAACRRALAQVDLEHIVDRSPNGLDADIGEAGARLSGGERQRLSIARAILRNPPVLLLDESTAHLDGESEARVRRAIDVAGQDRTVIVVAHRLSTVVDSDLIAVLQDGRIVARGTHRDLLASSELYRTMMKRQFGPVESAP